MVAGYPAFALSLINSVGLNDPFKNVTVAVSEARLTETSSTPGILLSAVSTRPTQDAHDIEDTAKTALDSLAGYPRSFKACDASRMRDGSSTDIVAVSVARLTETSLKPGTSDKARSTRPTQDAQFMPWTDRDTEFDLFTDSTRNSFTLQIELPVTGISRCYL